MSINKQRGAAHLVIVIPVVVVLIIATMGFLFWQRLQNLEPQVATTETSVEEQQSSPAEYVIPELRPTVDSMNQTLKPYGLTVSLAMTSDDPTSIRWDPLEASDVASLETFSAQLTQEFSKYPTDFVKNSGLKTIVLVKKLYSGSLYLSAQPRPSQKAMIYDVPSMIGRGDADSRHVVSHEYWHYIDYVISDGDYYFQDSQWSACNPSGFTYGSGGRSAYDEDDYSYAFHPQQGFITNYARYGIEEDRADLFGWMIYDPDKVEALDDSRIDCKIDRLTELARELSPRMSF